MITCCGMSTGKKATTLLKRWLYKLAGMLVSILFVYLAFRRVDLAESLRVLRDVRFLLLGLAVLVYLASFPVRALRWQLILRAQKAISLGDIIVPVFVGYMANNVLPARTGEIYRAHFLGRRVRTSRSGVAASIVVERAFDGLMLVVTIVLVFAFFPQAHFVGAAALVTVAGFLALAAVIVAYGLAAERAHRVLDRGLERLPQALRERVEHRMRVFLRGIGGVSTVRESLIVGALTALVWILEACAIAVVVVSFGVYLPPSGYLLVFALAALSTTLPSGPGYVGPYQYAFVLSLGNFAVPREASLAVSVGAQIALLGSVTAIGLALLLREKVIVERASRAPRDSRLEEETKVEERVG